MWKSGWIDWLNDFNKGFGIQASPAFKRVDWIDMESTLETNREREAADDHKAEMLREEQSLSQPGEDVAINDLFSR